MTWRDRGVRILRGAVDLEQVAAVNAAIDDNLARHFDPEQMVSYQALSACPELRRSDVLTALLDGEISRALAEELRAPVDFGPAQIAIRWPGGEWSAPLPHIDGIAEPGNGVMGPMLWTFSVLVGVFLTDSDGPRSGGFAFWPGSTGVLGDHFASRGRRALFEGMPDVVLGEPEILEVRAGDAVLCPYLLAHSGTSNTTPLQRRAVFFRGTVRGLAWHRYASLADPWRDWR